MLRWGKGVFCAVLFGLISQPVAAQSFTQFVGFGDSSIDSGWWSGALAVPARCDSVAVPCETGSPIRDALIRNALANGGTGAPVGVGLMNSQILAAYFGVTAVPANQPGGTNYAIAGSLDDRNAANGFLGNGLPNPNLPSTVQQIAHYLATNGGHADPNALYLVSSGGNDIGLALTVLPPGAQQAYLANQAAALSTAVATLQSSGARYIVVPNSYGFGPLFNFYNQTLWTDLHAIGVQFIPADMQSVLAAVLANPTAFGFSAATVLPGVVGPNTGSACVTPIGAPPTTSAWGSNCANTTTPVSIRCRPPCGVLRPVADCRYGYPY
jgi:outer membrane lipase/esterase